MITLTPQARAVAAFALAFTLLTGSLNRIAYLVLGIFDADLSGRGGAVIAALLLVAIAAGVLLLAFKAADAQPDGWSTHLAQSAIVLAIVGAFIAVLTLIAAAVQGEAFFTIGLYDLV
jgi:hypothetical protein